MLLSNLSIVEEPKGFSKSDTGIDNDAIGKGHFNVNNVFKVNFAVIVIRKENLHLREREK